jgi:hypothetical protein
MSFSQYILSFDPRNSAIVAGNKIMLDAKIGGITPDIFNFRGRCELCPP